MKKKILVVSHALELGGAERSLIGLLDAFDTTKYDIDLFLLRHEGELLCHIPKKINLLPQVLEYTVLARPMKDTLREGHFILTIARLFGKCAAQLYNKKHRLTDSAVSLEYSHKYTYRFMPKINPEEEYDLAISFLTPHYIVANNVKAKKKIAWIHTDYSKVQIHIESELKMWNQYDYIASVSDAVTDGFLNVFPTLKEKVCVIENILPKDMIMKQSEEFIVQDEMPEKGIRLLSIGRYCTAKNFDNVPEICSKLIEKGLDVYWYIIGFGGDEELIKGKITEFKMKDRVILLGKKDNPYPYIKACDVYIQPSRYEGKSVTVREAQMLEKPVIITNYATAKSQLKDGYDGVIVPMDNEKCANAICNILNNHFILGQLICNCKKADYSNREEINRIWEIINQYRFHE